MFRRFSVNFALFSMGMDALLICLALAFATYIRPVLSSLPFAADIPQLIPTPWIIYPVFAIEWTAILLLFSVYDGRRNFRIFDEFASLTLASLLASVALAGTLYLSFRQISRLLFLVFVLLAYSMMLGWRLIARLAFHLNKDKPKHQRRVLIVGAGKVGRDLECQISQNPELGLKVVGFLDDNPDKRITRPEIIGTLSNVKSIVTQSNVDDVVIALPQRAYKRMNRIVGELHRLPVKVWVIPDYFRLTLHKAAVEDFAGIPMLDLRAPALNDYQRMIKRAFDLTIAILSLPMALPLMSIITLLIKLEDSEEVLFRQDRVGENGHIFEMLKFRTMVPEAENLRHLVEQVTEDGRLIHKKANDPRVTRMGRILRRTSLDELPQLYNILKGDMSLVGPRPELPYLVDRYETWQRQRFAVPQGVTGWWQINGRSDKPMHLNTEDDLYYVQNYSLLLDIYILIKTIGVVIRGKGAY
jgi:exopolysaccharide biosynthesis polyprenyl glycosylphosphotransferase